MLIVSVVVPFGMLLRNTHRWASIHSAESSYLFRLLQGAASRPISTTSSLAQRPGGGGGNEDENKEGEVDADGKRVRPKREFITDEEVRVSPIVTSTILGFRDHSARKCIISVPAFSQFLDCHILCLQLGVILGFRVEGLASTFVQRMEMCGHVYHILGSHLIDFRNDSSIQVSVSLCKMYYRAQIMLVCFSKLKPIPVLHSLLNGL